ncbi:hypothetical protein [Olleya namhaensis]|uniref:Uncharacterized protein n=1 Tax=Olleya namhaensis TaxID=1144750 RepID=A0A1I3JD96_9FLAO|nr:hypothetical protein [Olleya namhaensis]SFI58217.1 hypothetical protein SAMN05443431_101359 [Olleya namhaensis]
MNKIVTKYLSLLALLLLTGLTNAHADTAIDADYALAGNHENKASVDANLGTISNFTIQQNETAEWFFDYTEAEEAENEETVSSTTINSFSSYILKLFHTQLLSDLSSKLQKEANSFTYIVCQPSTKLHVRLEVFII